MMGFFLIVSCASEQGEKIDIAGRVVTEMTPLHSHEMTILDYVFIDSNDVLHTTRRCHVLEDARTYSGRYYNTEYLPDIKVYDVCSQCVNYETWKELRAIGVVVGE